ncbi:hypothetical protein JTB14_028713 [Gonioctena quinquepunctata]|nr:hypothetical protein JTB14_028713 [Gonioctena quinquepunctata]
MPGRHGNKRHPKMPHDACTTPKPTYFNEGATKDVIHYEHLKYLLGGATLTAEHRAIGGEGPNRFRGLIQYTIDINDDNQGALSATFKFTYIHLMYSTIPLPWFPYFIKVFLRATDTYDLLGTPHLVLIKAIARIAYERYGPHINTWTRPETKHLSFKTVRRKFARRQREAGRYWKLMGTLEPLQVINAIEGTRHSGIPLREEPVPPSQAKESKKSKPIRVANPSDKLLMNRPGTSIKTSNKFGVLAIEGE